MAPDRGAAAMTLILRKGSAQARIEGLTRLDQGEDDYAVIHNETSVSTKIRASARRSGDGSCRPRPQIKAIADTLEEAKAALAARYEHAKRGEMIDAPTSKTPSRQP